MENFLLLKIGRTIAYLFINCLGIKKYTYIPFLPTDGSILHLPFIILMILYFINSRILSFLYFNITKIEMCLIVNIILQSSSSWIDIHFFQRGCLLLSVTQVYSYVLLL